MKRLLRAALVLASCTAALALANAANAALNPRFYVGATTQKGSTSLAIDARVAQTDDWVGRLSIYMPTGFKVKSPVGGTQVGTVFGQSIGTQIGDTTLLRLTGTITAIGLTDPASASQAAGCDTGAHAAVWMAKLISGNGNVWSFPIFVDATTGTETQFGAYKLVTCFGQRTTLEPNQEGNKLVSMSMNLRAFGAPTKPGDYKWRSLWTPFAANLSTLNDSATVEADSTTHIATTLLTISAHKSGTHLVLSGKLIVGGEAMDGIRIAVKHGSKSAHLVAMSSVKTNGSGLWTANARLKQPSFFQVGATFDKQDLGSAACTAAFTYPCVSATIGGTSAVSRLIHVR